MRKTSSIRRRKTVSRASRLWLGAGLTTALASCVIDQERVTISTGDQDAGVSAEASSTDAASNTDANDPGVPRPEPPYVTCAATGPCVLSLRAPFTRIRPDPYTDAWTDVATESHCALLSSGKVACWGDNTHGELGRTTPDGSTLAVGRPDFVEGVSGAKALDRGCALLADGRVLCWGRHAIPGISDGTIELPSATAVPIGAAKNVSVASAMGCALLANDQVTCWGIDTSSGQMAYALTSGADGGVYGPSEFMLPPGAPVVQVATGVQSAKVGGATYLRRADGTVLSWGNGLSLGRASSFSTELEATPLGISNVEHVTAAGAAGCAIADSHVYCWGTAVGEPKRIAVDDAIAVATAGARPLGRACAVTRRGEVFCWGDNDVGQVGDGTTTMAIVPQMVEGLPAPAVDVEVTLRSSCALLTTGKVHCWGENVKGQLGCDLLDDISLAPVEVTLPESP